MESFERRILDILLDGDHEALEILRGQLTAARVVSRDFTGSGCFTRLEVAADAARVDPPMFRLRDVWFRLEGCEDQGAAILFVDDGRLEALEVHNWSDDWPEGPRIEVSGYLARSRGEARASGSELERSPERDGAFLRFQIMGSAADR